MERFKMIDVGLKVPTRRRAVAQGHIHMQASSVERIRSGTLPKGDVLALAQAAGIMAAKKTSDILPLCHPLPLESIRVQCELEGAAVRVECEVITSAKTGVEMEALLGVQAALLCIWDLTKAIDTDLRISDIVLKLKEGGKSSHRFDDVKVGILTVSDRGSKGESEDRSGPELEKMCRESGITHITRAMEPDQVERIQSAVKSMLAQKLDLVLLTGGTGLSPRDVTPEALRPLITKPIPGIEEMLRAEGSMYKKSAYLSRSVAGLIEGTLVIALPGSTNAVRQGWVSLQTVLGHALHVTRGGDHS